MKSFVKKEVKYIKFNMDIYKSSLCCIIFLAIYVLERTSGQDCKKLTNVKSDELSVIYSEHNGGLAHQLLMYAMLRQLRQEFYLNAYMSKNCYDTLREVFTEKSLQDVPVFEDTFCGPPSDFNFEYFAEPMVSLLGNSELHHGQLLWLFPSDEVLRLDKSNERPFKEYKIDEHESPEHVKFVERYGSAMKRLLKFKPEIQIKVDEMLSKIASKMDLDVKEVLFIGIHNNRNKLDKNKDNGKSKKALKGPKPFKRSYFQDAMESMAEDYETNVAFLYVSDDMKWGQKNLEDGENYDLYFVGDGNPLSLQSVAHDLAIFLKCNHTIITRGAMSKWAAILAGGEYYTEYGSIVPNSVNDNIPKPELDDMSEVLHGGDSLDQFIPTHFSSADYEQEQTFYWDDIISFIKFDLYFWITSFLPF